MLIGICVNTVMYVVYYSSQSIMTWVYLFTQFGVAFQVTMAWMTPPFLIQILLLHFNVTCRSKKFNLFKECKKCLDMYNSFSKSFRVFFFVYFIFNQIYSIFYIFYVFTKLMKPVYIWGALMGVVSQSVQTAFVIFALNSTSSAIDESFESLQNLKIPIHERLLQCPGEEEKAQMNYLLNKIEDVKPMNACGYFEIGKSTLTSMLSVRLNLHTQS